MLSQQSNINSLKQKFTSWFEICKEHKKFMVDHLIKIKLYRTYLWKLEKQNQNKTSKSYKPHTKIKILFGM